MTPFSDKKIKEPRTPRHEPGILHARTRPALRPLRLRSVRSRLYGDRPIASRRFDHRPQSPRWAVQSTCSVLALNVEEGWVRDVSQLIAVKVRDVAQRKEQGLTAGTRAFVEGHIGPTDEQQMLPLWQ